MGHLRGTERFLVCATGDPEAWRLDRIHRLLVPDGVGHASMPARAVVQEPLRRVYVAGEDARPASGLLAFGGVAVSDAPSAVRGRGMVLGVRDDDPTVAGSDLLETRGNFTAALRVQTGDVVVCADPLGSAPLFVADVLGVRLLANDVWLLRDAAAAVGAPLTRDPAAFAIEAIFESGAFRRTGFREVALAELGEQYVVGADGSCRAIRVPRSLGWYRSECGLDELRELAEAEIRGNVRQLANAGYERRLADLTGGVDSRLVLAALFAEGVEDRFVYTCSGDFPGPDFTTFDYLLNVLDLTESDLALPRSGVDFLRDPRASMAHLLYRTMGCSSHAFRPGLPAMEGTGTLHLKGGFAETFKGFYSLGFAGQDPLDHLLQLRKWERSSRHLTPVLRSEILRCLEAFFADRHAGAVAPADALDQWYVENRNRYHFGVTWMARLPAETTFHPLYSPRAVQLGFAEGAARRANKAVAFRLMQRLCEPLTFLPFAGSQWPPLAEHSDRDRVLHASAPPITAKSTFPGDWHLGPSGRHRMRPSRPPRKGSHGGPGRSAWAQHQVDRGRPYWVVAFDQVLPVAREMVSSVGADSPVWEAFDYECSKRVLGRSIENAWRHESMQLVYKLLAAALWAEAGEQRTAPALDRD